MSSQVGSDIRAMRRSRKMTLQSLSDAIGRSPGWLSLIERGQAQPSIRDLEQVAALFDVNISFFFRSLGQNEDEKGLVVRAKDRTALGTQESGLVEELLSPGLDGAFEMIKSTFAPHATSGGMKPVRATENGGMLISGRLVLTFEDLSLSLSAGDSFQFQQKSYGWENPGDDPAVALWVVAPPVY
ncbi:helix-turn-helix domain-containing protein [Primorskyibacter sp. 2E107]|uniref:helix-turn-helix domain-containing protein n=1 Tax=Primorskyibacter sp. 2E107 TaxID=3403458 RepID=UPI003AF51036